jgi:hypothetical protein
VVGDDWFGKYDYLEEFGIKAVFVLHTESGVSSALLKK